MTRVSVRRIPPRARGLESSYAAHIQIPVGGYGVGDDGDAVISVGSVGFSFGSALRKATSIAKHITDDPIVKSMLPPQASAAIAATRKLAKAARRGRGALKGAWAQLPPGMKKKTKGLAKSMLRKLKKKKGRGDEEPGADEMEAEASAEELHAEENQTTVAPDASDEGTDNSEADSGGDESADGESE